MQFFDWLAQYRSLREIRKAEKENDKVLPLQAGDDWERYVETSEKIFEWRQSVLTKYLAIEAANLHVPLPDRRDKTLWRSVEYEDEPLSARYLTAKGIVEARRLIREEQKARREAIAFWIPILFGAAGTIIGIISVVNKS